MKVSVIILTWNGRAYLKECLDSLAAQTFRDFETILVDNGSCDGTADYIRNEFSWVRLLVLPENVGFAEGNNQGLAVAQGDYIVALNNDTKVAPDFLEELVTVANSDSRIGMVAAKMRNFYKPELIDAVGLKISVNGLGYNIGVGETDCGQYDAIPVFGPCGGAALYRRSMVEEIGFFDAEFFAYYEDFDLAWRASLAGWQCELAPKSLVWHIQSATGGEGSAFKTYHTHRNKWFVIIKNWPLAVVVRFLPLLLLTDGAALLLAALRGKILPAVRARVDVFLTIRMLLRKRHTVMSRRAVSNSQILSLFSPYESMWATFRRKMLK